MGALSEHRGVVREQWGAGKGAEVQLFVLRRAQYKVSAKYSDEPLLSYHISHSARLNGRTE